MTDDFLAGLSTPWPRTAAATIVGMLRRPGVVEESIKWGNPFFSLNGHAVVKIFVAHDWINVYFYRGAELSDPEKLLGKDGNSAMKKLTVGRDMEVPTGIRNLMDEAVNLASAAL